MNIQFGGAKKLKGKSDKNSSNKKAIKKPNFNLDFDLTGTLDNIEMGILRLAGILLGTILIYIILSGILTSNMQKKEKEVDDLISDTNSQIAKISSDNDKVNSKTSTYQELIDNLNKVNEALAEKYSLKFEGVPSGGLYWLRNLTTGTQERIFIVENGKMKFY